MIIRQVNLETVCGVTSRIPDTLHPQVAFTGRSNVGKSTLINALMNRKSLARTSATPGKTQTINYYNINDEIYFVDLPGYGYTHANERERAEWGRMVDKYLNQSRQLKMIFLLVDIRHKPSENDCMMYEWIKSKGYDPVIIATKLDKIGKSQIRKQVNLIRGTLKLNDNTPLIPFSSLTRQGLDEIYCLIDCLLEA